MHIDSYQFGKIVINGKVYDKDCLIVGDCVHANWWRKQGHVLDPEDLQPVIETRPAILIVGCGSLGLMKVSEDTRRVLKQENIEFFVLETDKAVEKFNELAQKGEHIPALAFAGGFTFEDQIYKALALGAPYTKLVGMARGPLAAAMVGKTIGKRIHEGQLPVYVERFGDSKDEVFVTSAELRKELGDKEFEKLPTAAIGLYTYYERLAQGLRQLMCGNRKFALEYISRDDMASLTKEAADISGITYITDVDRKEVEEILAG